MRPYTRTASAAGCRPQASGYDAILWPQSHPAPKLRTSPPLAAMPPPKSSPAQRCTSTSSADGRIAQGNLLPPRKGSTMKKYAHITVAVGALAGAVLALAPAAAAAPSSAGSAQDTVNRLQALGYSVALNGPRTAPLSDCLVTGIHPDDPGSTVAKQFTTVFVDIACPPTNN